MFTGWKNAEYQSLFCGAASAVGLTSHGWRISETGRCIVPGYDGDLRPDCLRAPCFSPVRDRVVERPIRADDDGKNVIEAKRRRQVEPVVVLEPDANGMHHGSVSLKCFVGRGQSRVRAAKARLGPVTAAPPMGRRAQNERRSPMSGRDSFRSGQTGDTGCARSCHRPSRGHAAAATRIFATRTSRAGRQERGSWRRI